MQANDDKTNNMECFWQQPLVGPGVDHRELARCLRNDHDDSLIISNIPDAFDHEDDRVDDDKNCVENSKSLEDGLKSGSMRAAYTYIS